MKKIKQILKDYFSCFSGYFDREINLSSVVTGVILFPLLLLFLPPTLLILYPFALLTEWINSDE